MKTLIELWDENGQKEFTATSMDGPHIVVTIVGIRRGAGIALGWSDNVTGSFSGVLRKWQFYREKKLVPHWPAIKDSDFGGLVLTNRLYPDDNKSWRGLEGFIRLATEYPPVMLEVEE